MTIWSAHDLGRSPLRGAVLQIALLAVCASVAVIARRVVAADTLPDAADLAVTFGVLLVIAVAFCIVRRLACRRSLLRTAALLALTSIGGVFVVKSYADTCVETASLLRSAPEGSAAVITLGPAGDDVRLAGEIRAGDAARLASVLDANPKVARIHLTSEGGLADEGEALGEVVAAHQLATYVPDYCVSACTLAFVRGRERLAVRDARIGFHAPFEEGVFDQVFQGDASAARAAYIDAGLAPDFVDEALETASRNMWFPEPARLLEARVVTAFVDRDRLPDSNLDSDPTPTGARSTVLRNFPILAGLDRAEPALVERIADWYLEAYRHEWSEARAVGGLRMLADSAVALVIAGADDASLVDLARFVAAAMQSAAPRDCEAIGARGDLVMATTILERDNPDAAKVAGGLVGAAMRGLRHTASGHAASSIAIAYRVEGPSSCDALRRAYAAALARPLPEAARLLRPRFEDWARRSVVPLAAAISDAGR